MSIKNWISIDIRSEAAVVEIETDSVLDANDVLYIYIYPSMNVCFFFGSIFEGKFGF